MKKTDKNINLAANPLIWEEITDIEYIEESSYPYLFVYDFSVKDIETFTIDNGIIVHNTLNTFHQCGISSTNVTQGVPRIRELISLSKSINTPLMTIYLKKEFENDENIAKKIIHDIQRIDFSFFVDNTSIWYDTDVFDSKIAEDAKFMHDHYSFINSFKSNDNDHENIYDLLSPWVLRIELHSLFLANKNVSMYQIYFFLLQKFEKKYSLHIIYNDEICEHIVFHLRIIYKNMKEKNTKSNHYQLLMEIEQELMNNCLFKGINQIEKAILTENKTICTVGTNLMEILQQIEYIDTKKTISNDIHEVYNTLGIEAAAQVLAIELYEVLNQSCVNVNKAHVNLLVDAMTLIGLVSINRYGITKSDNGVLAMASFEEPDEHFVNAAIYNVEEKMNGTSSNITMGQICPFGTGIVQLEFDQEIFQKFTNLQIDQLNTKTPITSNKKANNEYDNNQDHIVNFSQF